MSKLLIDTIPFKMSKTQINESLKENNGRLVVEGVLQRAEAENQNGRIYPTEILRREVKKYMGREVKENRAFGELDHPESSVVELKNTSHIVRNVWWDGDDVMGKVEILKTPAGNILKELLEAGCTVGISSRGMGSTQPMKDNKLLVGEDFELIGWDFVSNPSTHGAFMTPMNESVVKNIGTDVCGDFCKAQNLMREIITELA